MRSRRSASSAFARITVIDERRSCGTTTLTSGKQSNGSTVQFYVNIRDKQEIGVYDTRTQQMLTTWTTPGMKANTALCLDEKDQRLFVAGRKPGMFYVFDTNGKLIQQLPCADVNDDMSYDPTLKRIYVSGTQGLSVFHQDSPDSYTEILRIPTNGAKTSFFMPSLNQFYAVHPKNVIDDAGLLVFRVNP